MDLLAGYGSDASETSSSASLSSKEDGKLKPILKKPTIRPSPPTVSLPVTTKSTNNANNNDNNQLQQQQRRQMKRGKKILSLNAVLPAAIVERLTKREEKGYYTSSSDEEEGADGVGDDDDNGSKTNDRRRRRRRRGDREMNVNGSSQTPSVGSNNGVKSLLDDLKATKFCKTTKTNGEATTTTSSSTTTKESLPLGMAFTKVETTRTVVTKGDDNVVDIHKTKTDKKETNDGNHATASFKTEETPPDVNETKSHDTFSHKKRPPSTSLSSIPRPSKTARLPHPRPTHPPLYKTPSSTTSPPLPPPPPPPTTTLSKKEIARALRTGSHSIASLPIPTISRPVSLPSSSYDPSSSHAARSYATASRAGTDDASSSSDDPATASRYRGKNQINYLAQSAKAFEANRMAKVAMGGGGGGGGASHRVDAKKKYGW